MAYNTGNPVGSTDPRDLFDNAGILDKFANGEDPFYPDRFAVQRLSLAGMRYNYSAAQEGRAAQFAAAQSERAAQFQQFLNNSAYVPMGNYSAGLQFDAYNQYMAYGGNFYTPAPGSLPFTTSGTWSGADEELFVLFNQDSALRQDLGNTSDAAKGAGAIGMGAVDYSPETVGGQLHATAKWQPAIIDFSPVGLRNGQAITFSGRNVAGDPGGGQFTYYSSSSGIPADGGMVFATSDGGRLVRQGWSIFGFTGEVHPEWFGAKGDRATDDTAALKACSDATQALPTGGTIRLGSGRAYTLGSRWDIPKLPDKSIIIEGSGAVILNSPSYDGNVMYFGQPENTGGFPLICKDVVFRSSTANANAIVLEWASSSEFIGCRFIGFSNSTYLIHTYALVFDKCAFIGSTTAGVQSETYAHNLKFISCQFSGCSRDIYFQEAAHNLVLIATDLEGGNSCIVLDKGGTAVSLIGCYVEGKTSQPFVFGMPVTGFIFEGSWFGYNALQTWTNISGASFKANTYWDQQQNLGVSAIDVDIGANSYAGTSNRISSPSQAPNLINGYTNLGGVYGPAGFRKDNSSTVHLSGMLSGSADGVAFVLPLGYRPTVSRTFMAVGASGVTVGRVTVDASGQVTVIRASGSLCLDGLSFTAA